MKKTIALVASLDTKSIEISFMKGMIESMGYSSYVIDVGARKCNTVRADMKGLEVVRCAGISCNDLMHLSKLEMIEALRRGMAKAAPDLYEKGVIHGMLSIGGLQNTLIAVSGMKALPIGFPKIMVSTVASGNRAFETIVGSKDIVVIPSIVDFTGRNMISDVILRNAVASMAGMVEHAGKVLEPSAEIVVGATLMGVVNDGVAGAVDGVRSRGYEVLSFHSTGVGGRTMDELIRNGMIHAVMDFSLHEIVGECFGGYSAGSYGRLEAAGKAGIPMVVAPGAVDFLDYESAGLPFSLEGRRYLKHNAGLYHIKTTKSEILKIGRVIVGRLNASTGPVRVLLPLNGFRQAAGEGQALYDPDVDGALIDLFKRELNPSIRIIEIDCNINEEEFVSTAVSETVNMISNATFRR